MVREAPLCVKRPTVCLLFQLASCYPHTLKGMSQSPRAALCDFGRHVLISTNECFRALFAWHRGRTGLLTGKREDRLTVTENSYCDTNLPACTSTSVKWWKSAKLVPMVFCLFYFLRRLKDIRLQSVDEEAINNLTSKCPAAVSCLGTDRLLKDTGWFVLGRKTFEILGQSEGRVQNLCVCVRACAL